MAEATNPTRPRRALLGLFATGVLLALIPAVMPAWGYHLHEDYRTIGHYFLSITIGVLLAATFSARLLNRYGIRGGLTLGCSLGFAVIAGLALAAPPAAWGWRALGFFGAGLAAGAINTAVLHAISTVYQRNPAAAVNIGGAFFGTGSLVATVLVAGAFHVYTVGSLLFLVALIPGFLAISFGRTDFGPYTKPAARPRAELARELANPSALLFSVLLFFQFGNEWALAGWLPMFLIQRLGVSPSSALMVTALYWMALVAGRIIAQWTLPHTSHWKMLISSGTAAVFGCLVLAATNNLFGASLGAAATGFGFAAIYPLVVEKIGDRFPAYHPGLFNGVFSFALMGGLLAPAHLGYLAEWLGIRVVMLLPGVGTLMVLLLSILIWVDARFGSGSAKPKAQRV